MINTPPLYSSSFLLATGDIQRFGSLRQVIVPPCVLR